MYLVLFDLKKGQIHKHTHTILQYCDFMMFGPLCCRLIGVMALYRLLSYNKKL